MRLRIFLRFRYARHRSIYINAEACEADWMLFQVYVHVSNTWCTVGNHLDCPDRSQGIFIKRDIILILVWQGLATFWTVRNNGSISDTTSGVTGTFPKPVQYGPRRLVYELSPCDCTKGANAKAASFKLEWSGPLGVQKGSGNPRNLCILLTDPEISRKRRRCGTNTPDRRSVILRLPLIGII